MSATEARGLRFLKQAAEDAGRKPIPRYDTLSDERQFSQVCVEASR
jgi:hypothetical protein